MANQNAKIDENYRKSLLGVTDDVSAEIRRLLVNPDTGRLKVSAVIAGGMISILNGLEESTQTFAVGTAGTDFGIVSAEGVHTFNIPTASATNRGLLSSTDWSTFNGKADLVAGKVPTSQLPALAFTDVSVVASQVAQLALTAEEGDVAIRSDLNKSYIHNGGTAGTMADWSEMLTPTDTVLSVNGETGAVTLNQDDIGDGTTYKQYSATEKTKLAGIETGADVTDAGNVEDAISGSGETTTPADANLFSLIVGGVLTKLSWANLKSVLISSKKATGAEVNTGTDDTKIVTPKAMGDSDYAKKTQESWIAPTLQNSWVNFDGGYDTAGYMKDNFGIVHLKGFVKNGTVAAGTPIFTLPSGYRPSASKQFVTTSNGAYGGILITSDGVVSCFNASNVNVSLEVVHFKI